MAEEKSELQNLLEKNASDVGLTHQEYKRALELILNAKPTGRPCWLCDKMYSRDVSNPLHQEIFDTRLCQQHALVALITRK